MIKAVFLMMVFAVVSGYEINFGCSDYCNDCINKNIAPTLITHNQCAMTRESTHFRISVRGNNNGCGYTQDINDVYNKCANECQTCRKVDSNCKAFTDHPFSTIYCKPRTCIKRGEHAYSVPCCDGLIDLKNKCIDPKQDCTECGESIVPDKPCCNTSGINDNGKWRCAVGTCSSCKTDDACAKGKRCIAGCCG
jgi:hypothetical protein